MSSDRVDKDVIKAFLGKDTEFKGLLSFEGTVRIDGNFEGEVVSEDNLIIGENAQVKAEIKVGSVMIQGRVEGNIKASRKLHVSSKGKVFGNVETIKLHIEEGAILEGNVSMISHGENKVLPLIPRQEPAGAKPNQASGGAPGTSRAND